MKKEQETEIKSVIKKAIRTKISNYNPETKSMPFHFRLLGRDRMALFSFIHSLNTTFGTSIFEPVAEILARNKFKKAVKQYIVGDEISEKAQTAISRIINDLSTGKDPDKLHEIDRIRQVATVGKINKIKTVKVDLMCLDKDEGFHFFDLKTAKPNISNFKDFKRTLLEWCAIAIKSNPEINISTYIAIPYNPYSPKPYERWTMKGMLDIKNEIKVAEEFWNFLGGIGAYEKLLDCFEEVGIEIREEIDERFSQFK